MVALNAEGVVALLQESMQSAGEFEGLRSVDRGLAIRWVEQPELSGLVGVGQVHPEIVQASVGVIYEPYERILEAVLGPENTLPKSRRFTASHIGKPMSSLVPGRTTYSLAKSSGARLLVNEVLEYGVPWVRLHATVGAIEVGLRPGDDLYSVTLRMCWRLAVGQLDDGLQLMDDYLRRSTAPDPNRALAESRLSRAADAVKQEFHA